MVHTQHVYLQFVQNKQRMCSDIVDVNLKAFSVQRAQCQTQVRRHLHRSVPLASSQGTSGTSGTGSGDGDDKDGSEGKDEDPGKDKDVKEPESKDLDKELVSNGFTTTVDDLINSIKIKKEGAG